MESEKNKYKSLTVEKVKDVIEYLMISNKINRKDTLYIYFDSTIDDYIDGIAEGYYFIKTGERVRKEIHNRLLSYSRVEFIPKSKTDILNNLPLLVNGRQVDFITEDVELHNYFNRCLSIYRGEFENYEEDDYIWQL